MHGSERFGEDETEIEVAYFIDKKRISLKTYPDLLALERKHGVDIGSAYNNEKQCGTFIDYIGMDIKNRLNKELQKANFFSILCDGSTDCAVVENEVTYALHFDPAPPNSDSIEVKLTFLGMNSVADQNAQGIASSLLENMKSLGMEDPSKKLIGFTSDGASVNRGNKGSVKTILRECSEWMVFIWCIAHRLELSLKDALSGTVFDDIDELLLRIYYLYQKAPKKLRELRKLHEAYADIMEYEEGGVKPKRASGTRWISHKLEAMKICLDKWALYMTHLEDLIKDKTVKSEDRAKITGYSRKWKKARIPLLLALFIDMLEIPAILSKCFKDDKIDTVSALRYLSKAKSRLALFKEKRFEKLPHVKQFLRRCTEIDGATYYQNQKLPGFEDAKSSAKVTKEIIGEKVVSCISKRLEEEKDSELLFHQVAHVLNTEGWRRTNEDGEEDTEFADDDIIALKKKIEKPLSAAGVTASDAEFLSQWHSLIEYAKDFLSVGNTPYRKCWRSLFISPRSSSWKDVLTLIELLFSIPISNAKLERMFSKMKLVKVVGRCSLSQERLESILRIMEDGPSIENFDPTSSVNLWLSEKDRRPKQKRRKYGKRKQKERTLGSLSDSSFEDDEMEQEVEEEEELSLFDDCYMQT